MSTAVVPKDGPAVRLGLHENVAQFTLLVVVNAFVGAMVGMERTILPVIAEQEFRLVARTAVLSFIVIFGVAKALTNQDHIPARLEGAQARISESSRNPDPKE